MSDQRDFCVHGVYDEDEHFRYIEVGGVRFEERVFRDPDLGDGASVTVTKRARGDGVLGVTALSATELAYLGRQICEWFTSPSENIAMADDRIERVRAELEKWNARAREDEEHPPYDDLVAMLTGALNALERLRAMFGTGLLEGTQPRVLPAPAPAARASAVDPRAVAELQAAYSVSDDAQLQRRLQARPALRDTLLGAAIAIGKLFNDGRPILAFESSGRIDVRIPTKVDADAASELYDRLLDSWWRDNVTVADKMSLSLEFR